MIKYFLMLFMLLSSTVAYADTIPIPLSGGVIQVHQGDIIYTSKPLVEKVDANGVLTQRLKDGWVNRMNSARFSLSGGATKLKAVAPVPTVGYKADAFKYQVLDGAVAAPTLNPFGVNLAGCYASNDGALCPNQDDIDWYTAPAQNFQLFRVAFKDVTPTSKLYFSIDSLLAKGATVVMDRHHFTWHTPDEQIPYWIKKAAPYKSNPRVIIDLMNEPRDFNDTVVTNDWMQWATDTKAIIAGLRAAGFNNTIAVEWPGSSAIYRFNKHEADTKACESAVCAIKRVGGLGDTNLLMEGHMYWDDGGTGTHWECVTKTGFWYDSLRADAALLGYKAYMGEGAGGNAGGINPVCRDDLNQAVAEIKGHPDDWLGITWWGGGREWPENYVYKIEPKKGTRAQVPHSEYLEIISGR